MVTEIGDSAGKLWHYLGENPSSTLDQAAKALKVRDCVLAMAAGWLAREDKLLFATEGKTVRLSLK
jgi:hypothetical protein